MIRIFALLLALFPFSVTVIGQQGTAAQDATVLRVSRVILYKTGIGYFEHLGSLTGNQSLSVQFTGDQLDDVLKSLTAVDLGDGRVSGISYDSPTPAERRLQALRLPLGPHATRLQVLDALRGSRVEVRTSGAVVAGRLLNVERRTRAANDGGAERDEITLVTDGGEIVTLDLDAGARVRVVDSELRQDVNRFLDVTASSGDRSLRRVVLSTLGTGQRQILVSYVGEAAVWKTTYRLVFPTAAGSAPLLQGWAIVDNISAADWDNIELSLVAGAPQAFRQALATPLFATRPLVPLPAGAGLTPQVHAAPVAYGSASLAGVVRDPNGAVLPGVSVTVINQARQQVASDVTDAQGAYRIAGLPAGTFEIRAELPGFNAVSMAAMLSAGVSLQRDLVMSIGAVQETVAVSAESPGSGRPRVSGMGGGRPLPPPPPPAAAPSAPSPAAIESRLAAQPIAATGANLGELFEYRLRDRVTIKRNQSALVPILQTAVKAERVSLWNDAMGLRPRRAVWLTNSSELTLDAGSLAIVDAGAFAGEGLLDTIKPGERRLVSFAADAGVQVAASPTPMPGRITRVQITGGIVTEHVEHRQRRSYTIRNDDRESRLVLIEHPANAGWKFLGAVQPDETTASVHRFRVIAPARQTTMLEVEEQRLGTTTLSVNDFHRDYLLRMTERADARAALERVMAPVFEKSLEIDAIEREIEKREEEVAAIARDQARVRDNMAVLKGSSSERQLLQRYTRQLDAQETRLDTLQRELATYTAQRAQAERELAERIAAVRIDLAL